MRLTLSRDPMLMLNRMQNLFPDDKFFNIDFDNTELDMYEKDNEIIVNLKAPGYEPDQIDVAIEGNDLVVNASAKTESEEENKARKYYHKEISQKSFTRSVTLPYRVKAEAAQAEYKNGMLTLTLPKAEESIPKKIAVKVKGE